jgi:DDE superfamily endonuclease/Archaeal putative transposase ISC1217
MPPLPETILLVLAPFAPLFSHRVWLHAQVLLVGAMLTPGPRTVTAALRVMGLALERRFTNYHRVLNRATWSALQGSRTLLGLLLTILVPPGATIVLGADDTVEHRSGRKITAKGCYRDAVRSTKKHVVRCFGLKWVSMMLLVPMPWGRRVWALPFLTALCRPAEKHRRRRHKTSIDWVRQMMKQVRRWLPGRRLVLVVDGGFAAVWLALACVKSRVVMVSRLRWDAALYHPPGLQPQGKRGPKPTKGKRQRSLQSWAERSDTPWEDVEVDWYGGQRKKLWVFSRTALWYTPRLPPVAIRYVLVADPEGKLRMEAFFCTDLQATPEQILAWVVMRWSVEVTFEEIRAHLGLETQRQWSALAIARTTPVLLGLFSLVTMLALQLSGDGQIPVPVTAWYHKDEPTFSDCLAVVRRHLWRARYSVNSTPQGECRQFPQAALDLLIHGIPLAA